jgi:hypothetical protein
MTDSSNWLEYNSRYLSNAVERVRMLLERRARQKQDMALARPPEPPPEEKSKSRWWLFGRKLNAAQDELASVATAGNRILANPAGMVASDSAPASQPALVLLAQRGQRAWAACLPAAGGSIAGASSGDRNSGTALAARESASSADRPLS